ncbi:hypothetical protein EJB05_14700, partial [Eragrostis curvula]
MWPRRGNATFAVALLTHTPDRSGELWEVSSNYHSRLLQGQCNADGSDVVVSFWNHIARHGDGGTVGHLKGCSKPLEVASSIFSDLTNRTCMPQDCAGSRIIMCLL